MKLTYKYKPITKYATNLLLGVLCAYSVCACDGVERIVPVSNTDTDNDQSNTQYDPDPTDTGSDKPENQDKPGEQNNQNDQDNHWEQPDENNQETPNDYDTPSEQPDQDTPNEHDDTDTSDDTSDEQPDQDTSNEHDDTDTSAEQPDQDVPDPQDNQGKCDPGYVWVDYDIDYWVHKDINDGVNHDKQCVACVEIPTVYELARKTHDIYCPGGDDLKDENLLDQLRSCPKGQIATANLDACLCPYGAPPPPNGECLTAQAHKKSLITNPKVNVSRRNNSTTQLLLRHKMRERKTNKR